MGTENKGIDYPSVGVMYENITEERLRIVLVIGSNNDEYKNIIYIDSII